MNAGAAGPRADVVDLPGPITNSPDPGRRRRRWQWVQKHLPNSLQQAYSSLVVPAEPPEGFASIGLEELAKSLASTDLGTAHVVLLEAQAAHEEPYDRIESAERRATTLQGTVAIAASAAVAGAGLMLSDSSIEGDLWRASFAVLLVFAIGALLACAVRAVGVTGRMFQFEEPGLERIPHRATLPESEALTLRAAELLRAADVAGIIGTIKVGLLRSAAWWFRAALLLLGLVAALVCAYVLSNPAEVTQHDTTTMIVAPSLPSLTTHPAATARSGALRQSLTPTRCRKPRCS